MTATRAEQDSTNYQGLTIELGKLARLGACMFGIANAFYLTLSTAPAHLSGLGGDPSFYYSAPKGGMLWVFSIDGKVDQGDAYNAEVIEKMLPSYKP